METQDREKFSYAYSAKEQAEIKHIRRKYAPREEDKMEQLRKLDAGVHQKAAIQSVIVGVIGALILGIGMCGAFVCRAFGLFPALLSVLSVWASLPRHIPSIKRLSKKSGRRLLPKLFV